MTQYQFNQDELAARLGINPPFLMIDSYQEIEQGERAIATKQTSQSDWWFACHLPAQQVMPGTLLVEGMLQTLVFLIYNSNSAIRNPAFITNMKVKIHSAVKPGVVIQYTATLNKIRRGIAFGAVRADANKQMICSGEFEYAVPDLMQLPKQEL